MKLAAFLALALLAVVRLPAIRRGGAGTLSELALITGAGALFMVGTVVPLPVLDGWVGGVNFANLLQNSLATAAIWFMTMTAIHMTTGRMPSRRAVWELVIVIGTFATAFLFIDRGPMNTNFINVYADSVWLWLYACIYMAYVAYLMIRMFISLGKRDARPYVIVRIGAVMMCAGSILEIVYLTGRVLGARLEWAGQAFDPLFYLGIILIAAGLAWFPLARQARNLALIIANAMLRRANSSHPALIDHHAGDTLAHGTYRLAVQLADIGNSVELSPVQLRSLRFATRLLDLQVPAPKVIRMSANPEYSS